MKAWLKQEGWILGLLVLIVLIFFHFRYGLSFLNPLDTEWIMARGSDWSADFMTWEYFRHSPWQFPLGLMEGYAWPGKVSIGLTGAIPLFAIPFKIFAPVLPESFQYYSIWLFLCFLLQGWIGYRLLSSIGIEDKVLAFLGSLFFVFSCSLIDRVGHLNLNAHWIILASLLIYFSGNNFTARIKYHAILVFLSIWIHPYLIPFCFVIALVDFASLMLEGRIKFTRVLVATGIMGVAFILAWALIGNLSLPSGDGETHGFGEFSANLNAFLNPPYDSILNTRIQNLHFGQYEGLAYIGIGMIILILLGLAQLTIKKTRLTLNWRNGLMAITGLGFFVFALSNQIALGDKLLVSYPWPAFLDKLGATFRASGRYIWLPQYLIILGALVLIARSKMTLYVKYGLLIVALIINLVELKGHLVKNQYVQNPAAPIENFQNDTWRSIFEPADKIVMYPPYDREYYNFGDDAAFVRLAAQTHTPITTGHLARYNSGARQTFVNDLESFLDDPQNPSNETVYVVHPDQAYRFRNYLELFNPDVFDLNGFLAYIPKSFPSLNSSLKAKGLLSKRRYTNETFASFAERNSANGWFVVVRDEASKELQNCPDIVDYFTRAESKLSEIQYRQPYLGYFL
ncbi:MAG: hypothetical protein HKN16_13445, partial [Saprospiraceae bacterium]|nr:hypothetical protein [Saprospiraceae bacterium]